MKPLSLLFLGSPVVGVAEAPKIELSKKTIVLLGYLESRPGMHRREKIAEWLWGGSDEARQNLRQCLFHLPNSLKEYGFEVTLDEIGLPLSRYSSDLKRFDDALRKANALSGPNERIELLKLALQIPRGEFLEGIAAKGVYRHWLAQEREKWNTKHAGVSTRKRVYFLLWKLPNSPARLVAVLTARPKKAKPPSGRNAFNARTVNATTRLPPNLMATAQNAANLLCAFIWKARTFGASGVFWKSPPKR